MGEVSQDVFSQSAHSIFLVDLISGVCGGCSGILAGHPLDTIKVRLQTQGIGGKLGIVSCFQGIVRKEGFFGLYKGMASPMIGVAIVNSMLFAVYGSALRFCSKDPDRPTLNEVFLAGALSGGVNALFSCPMELIKIRLQNQTNPTPTPGGLKDSLLYKGPVDCVRKIIKANGILGLFKGFSATFIREVPSYGAYFASYEIFCQMIPSANPSEPGLGLLLAGGLAGVVGWGSTYPVDVIKTRLQSISEDQKPKYINLRTGFRIILKEEGARVLFAGLGATALRAFPTNAATFFGVVWCRNFLDPNSKK